MASSPITCHVLDTLSGLPASNLNVVLTLLTPRGLSSEELPPSGVLVFHAVTNEDGRIKEWMPNTKFSVQDALDKFDQGDESVWSLKFDTGKWYREKKIECFFPEYFLDPGPTPPIADREGGRGVAHIILSLGE